MAKAVMVMGTASDVGKSVVAAGLCRLLHRRGIRVAPFKAQNMSLNSFVTVEGGEIGRAQALQSQACGLPPHTDMNPILLKPEADNCSQVVVHGKVWGRYEAQSYFKKHDELIRFVKESYERLDNDYDVIVIEGAGSAAEVNLRDKDIVNWPIAKMADAGVLLVADIDRGGVFAQVIGTLDLLSSEERQRVVGLIINKFRGDRELFRDGVAFLEKRSKLPVLGVVPFLRNLELDQEDSLNSARHCREPFTANTVNVAVVLLPHMSNFTDFNALAAESDIVLRYVASPSDVTDADVVILPGSKNTLVDLDYLEQAGFVPALNNHVARGAELVGICGGYQMLGTDITDPLKVEAGGRRRALGFLDVTTELTSLKRTVQVEATPFHGEVDATVRGYEVHIGRTRRGRVPPCFQVLRREEQNRMEGHQDLEDGAMRVDRMVWGTYIHGVFDSPGFRRFWINQVRKRKALSALPVPISEEVSRRLSQAIDRWADHLEQHLDLSPVFAVLELGSTGPNTTIELSERRKTDN